MSSQSNLAKVKSEKAQSLDQVYSLFEKQKGNIFLQTLNNFFLLFTPHPFFFFFRQTLIKI